MRFDERYPFASTGCDYLGPLYVFPVYETDKSKLYKAYMSGNSGSNSRGCEFLQYEELSANFRRFMARRGCPALVISFNGSSFIADETQEFAANHVACSPWMGGIWEQLVSCVKKCLKWTIGMRQINDTELQKLILQVEVILTNLCRLR